MSPTTPRFSALRAVEAASRHRSFTWAARELQVTHSAVSQSIRRLEAELGTSLFERRGGAMEPSDAALRLAQSYAEAAQALEKVICDITGDQDPSRLTVAMPADLGRLWFAGKQARLSDALPDVGIAVCPPGERADLELSVVAACRPSDQMLAELETLPVCTAGFSESHRIETPAALVAQPLLEGEPGAWSDWAASCGVSASDLRIRSLPTTGAALQAALAGDGVALADQFTAESVLSSGELIVLPFVRRSSRTLVLRSHVGKAKTAVANRFVMWLNLEVARGAAMAKAGAR